MSRRVLYREWLGGLFIGPDRCSECGSLWPLLPPPVGPTVCALNVGGYNVVAARRVAQRLGTGATVVTVMCDSGGK